MGAIGVILFGLGGGLLMVSLFTILYPMGGLFLMGILVGFIAFFLMGAGLEEMLNSNKIN
jgi:hypothetical protein